MSLVVPDNVLKLINENPDTMYTFTVNGNTYIVESAKNLFENEAGYCCDDCSLCDTDDKDDEDVEELELEFDLDDLSDIFPKTDSERLAETLKGKLCRVFYKGFDGINPEYEYIDDVYSLGGKDTIIKTAEDPNSEDFVLTRLSKIEEIQVYEADQED